MPAPLTLEQAQTGLPKDTRLKIICFLPSKGTKRMVKCKCSCGKTHKLMLESVRSGVAKSCGCYNIESILKRQTKAFPVINDVYKKYKAMMSRCYNTKDGSYHRYGGSGVTVCDEWKNSYQSFLDWSLKNGYKKGMQLDKDIVGTGKIYSPETCKYVTRKENMNCRSTTRYYQYNGVKVTASYLADICGVSYEMMKNRLRAKSPEQAVKELL